MDLQEAFDAGFDAVRGYVDRSFASFEERIARLETSVPDRGEKGEPGEKGLTGEKGLNGTPGEKGQPGDAGARGEKGEPGEKGAVGEPGPQGVAGKDADPAVIASMVAEEVAKAVGSLVIPPGEKGEPGERGEPGMDGKDADPAVIESAVNARMVEEVAKAVGSLVIPTGEKGAPGEKGEKGDAGRDGASLVAEFLDQDGALVVVSADGTRRNVGVVKGKDGRDGADGKDGAAGLNGKDGLGFDDLEERIEDEGRTVVRVYRRGEETKEFRHSLPQVIDRGVWKDGQEYQPGDGATWSGSWFIAQRMTKDKPETPDCGWRLAVKRGREGKPGERGVKGEKGDPGKDGDPGRNTSW